MLNRCSPRSRTSAVRAKGSASTASAPAFPVKNAASSCSVPRPIVPSTTGLALDVSLKNMLSRSGIALGWLCMSCLQPAAASRRSPTSRPRLALRLAFIDLARIQRLQEIQRLHAVELRVRRFDEQEELVPAGALEALDV